MFPLWTCLLSSFLFTLSAAQNNTCDDGCDYDPILQYRPNFARSLPVQILLTGVVLTLVAVLLIHLIFTAQYHWPLAQVNYILQVSGVSTLLISLIATLHVVLGQSIRESLSWPYMLSYIAVDLPPLAEDDNTMNWTPLEQATWLVMHATTSGLIQITHIHFLTLLYPSRLEARLIYILLGPLAVVSAIMQLIPIRGIGNQGNSAITAVVNYSDAVRNVCNATLSFLFTASLFVWGFFVNRKQAWRTDGGTAAFGVGALVLAIMSTVLNILYIPSQDQYVWLPSLMWAVVLWQSFLGWWWWVGAGMGVGEVEELLKREAKRERKRKLRKERRKEQKEKAKLVWKGVTAALTYRGKQGDKTESDDGDDETVILDDESFQQEEHPRSGTSVAASREARAALSSSASMVASSSVGSSATTTGSPYTRATRFLHKWYDMVRLAHLTAARKQAVERVERIQQVYRREEASRLGVDPGVAGWGLGSYGIREMEREPKFGKKLVSDDDDEGGGDETLSPSRPERAYEGQAGDRRVHISDESIIDPARIEAAIREERRQPSSMWWWGPLRRWRLQDATVYS